MELILASASPRRQELLHLITSRFTVLPADIDETLPPELPADHAAQYLAQLKAGITLCRFQISWSLAVTPRLYWIS